MYRPRVERFGKIQVGRCRPLSVDPLCVMSSLNQSIGHPPREWLQKQVTVDDADQAMRDEAAMLGIRVSDRWLKEWSEFKSIIRDGDELWHFEWFPEPLSGAAGYCIVRGGLSVASITTRRA